MLSGSLNLLSYIIQEGLPTFPEVALLLMGWTLPYYSLIKKKKPQQNCLQAKLIELLSQLWRLLPDTLSCANLT